LLVAAIGIALSACTKVQATDPPFPADAVLVRVFTEGQGDIPNPETYQWHFHGTEAQGSAQWDGPVTTSTEVNCVVISPHWTLRIVSQEAGGDVVRWATDASHFRLGRTVDVFIERTNDHVTVSEGLPPWWAKGVRVPCGIPGVMDPLP
jgi:hypothetical protein